MNYNPQSAQEYRQQAVAGAGPLHLVIMAYDVAITACEQRDFSRATRAIGLLRDSLEFEKNPLAPRLFGLYQWCLECVRGENYSPALKTLRSLREAWATLGCRMAADSALPARPRSLPLSSAAG